MRVSPAVRKVLRGPQSPVPAGLFVGIGYLLLTAVMSAVGTMQWPGPVVMLMAVRMGDGTALLADFRKPFRETFRSRWRKRRERTRKPA